MNKLYSFGFCFGSENRLTFSAKNFVAEVFMFAPFKGRWVGVGTSIVRRKRAGTHYPIATTKAGAVGQGQVSEVPLGAAAHLISEAETGAGTVDPACQRPAAGPQIQGAAHGTR